MYNKIRFLLLLTYFFVPALFGMEKEKQDSAFETSMRSLFIDSPVGQFLEHCRLGNTSEVVKIISSHSEYIHQTLTATIVKDCGDHCHCHCKVPRGLDGSPAILIAAENGHKDIVALLLGSRANASVGNIYGDTPLMVAAKNGHEHIVQMLLKATNLDSIHLLNEKGKSALTYAAQYGHKSIVEMLLKHLPSSSIKKGIGTIALAYACVKGHKEIVSLLKSCGAHLKPTLENTQALWNTALKEDQTSIVKVLFKTIYSTALNYHDEKLIDKLVSLFKQKSHSKKEPKCLCTLIKKGIEHGSKEVIQTILNHKINVSTIKTKSGATPLHIAVLHGHYELVYMLLEAGAQVNIQDNEGYTPLMRALAQEKQAVLIKLLSAVGASTTLITKKGENLITIAKRKKHLSLLIEALKASCHPRAIGIPLLQEFFKEYPKPEGVKVCFGCSKQPEHVSTCSKCNYATYCSVECQRTHWVQHKVACMKKYILDQLIVQENINQPDDRGQILLMHACHYGFKELVEKLIALGADINVYDTKGNTALTLAQQGGHKEIITMLIDAAL